MSNIFAKQQPWADRPKRNTYDMSFTNNFTANFGTLYPVLCQEVNPNDSISIDCSFGLRAQPMAFPIQTRIRADVHFFYVRNRTLWDNFMDFYGKTKDGLVHPYIEQLPSAFKTGSIYDYLGVPTSVMSGSAYWDTVGVNPYDPFNTASSAFNNMVSQVSLNQLNSFHDHSKFFNYINRSLFPYTSNMYIAQSAASTTVLGTDISPVPIKSFSPGQITGFIPLQDVSFYSREGADKLVFPNAKGLENFTSARFNVRLYFYIPGAQQLSNDIIDGVYNGSVTSLHGTMLDIQNDFDMADSLSLTYSGDSSYFGATLGYENGYSYLTLDQIYLTVMRESPIIRSLYEYGLTHNVTIYYCFAIYSTSANSSLISALGATDENGALLKYSDGSFVGFGNVMRYLNYSDVIKDASTLDTLPWTGSNKDVKLNALPYRAYEAIYNSFFRNTQNDPFKINGVPEYNKFVTNRGDGADSYPYKLYQRNWELDFLTSCVQSPQQGNAPLVGITVNNADSTATMKFQSSELANLGVPNGEVTAQVSLDDDGTIIGIDKYDDGLPSSTIQRLMADINAGISINDFRQVNAFQRWLEKNIRRGYRYRDQLMSHHGSKPSFNELLMPEFIGGTSKDVNVTAISQTVTNENGVLGELAGQASAIGSSRNRIHKYCDEAGFIIGILSIVPIPVYSQVPAPYAFKSNLFDYYFPEFGKLPLQPIYNFEVTPLQTDDLNGVFGYQRAWSRLISNIDEAHGEFRTTAAGYLIHRQFADAPKLNGNFLKIDNDYINDVFAITNEEVSNQFLGAINFNIKKKTAIPLFGEPSIEPYN